MMATISAAAARAGDSAVGRWYGKTLDVIDNAIPITIGAAVIVGMLLVVFDLII